MPRPVHFEIHAGDPERAVAFYTAVFGWKFERWGDIPRVGPAPEDSAPVHGFVNTIAVTDLDHALDAVNDAGGSLALPKNSVPGVGWLAYVKDTEGNIFGMLQPDSEAPAPG
jgi:predicted enzyme related to lactoylglutathione lyase